MSPRAADLFRQAIGMPPEERAPFLARTCPDPAERAEVEALLAHDREGDSIVAGPIRSEASALAREIESAKSLPTLGAYRAVKLIGHGGMGAVYLAERIDGTVEQQVAVKLLPMALAGGRALERSLEERRILAKLDHPGIARFQDAGATPDGVPFLVMEYVRGAALDACCEQGGLDLEARVRLFRKVCDAVDYAHRNLILHRDLKPENILVTESGQPKLLDFGIAKVVDPDHAASRTMLAAMTPDYASPEQVRGEATGVSTDIYSLGAVLYRILTGQRPHRIEGSTAAAIERAICDEPAVPPSSHRRELRGDLENILLKALRKEPQRRYRTVAELAADLDAWLSARPVSATPDSFAYRAGRFLSRNRSSVALVTVASAAVLGFGGYAIVQGRRAERRFEEIRKLANVFLFDFEKSVRNVPGAIRARELVVKTGLEYLDRLAADSASDPRLTAELAAAYTQMAEAQGSLVNASTGESPAALRSLERGVNLYRGAGASLSPEARQAYFKALGALAILYSNQNRGAEAMETLRRGVAEAAGWMAREPSSEAALTSALGLAYHEAELQQRGGALTEAITAGQRAVQIAARIAAMPGSGDTRRRSLGTSHFQLGNALVRAGRNREAAQECRKAVEILRPLGEPEGIAYNARRTLMIGYAYLAEALEPEIEKDAAARAEAAGALRKGADLAERGLRDDPANVLAMADLTNMLVRVGRGEAALRDFRKASGTFARSVAMARRWSEKDRSTQPLTLLIEGLTQLTQAETMTGATPGALAAGREAVELAKRWRREAPAERQTAVHLADAQRWYGVALERSGDRASANFQYVQAEKLAAEVVQQDPADGLTRKMLSEIRDLRHQTPGK